MAKKIVRGITGVKNIKKQGLDTNNVNDLLSDGEHNYIHRKKKDKSEEYHNLTDNIKTIDSDNTSLLSVTNYNNTKNSATLHPHHDAQKEQKLYSTDKTIEIVHGDNGTGELTNVDINPKKVLTHDNLLTSYGISKKTSENNTTLGIEYTEVPEAFDLNNLTNGYVKGYNLTNAPQDKTWYFVSTFGDDNYGIQDAKALIAPNTTFRRVRDSGKWMEWREQVGDKTVIDSELASKQATLKSSMSIGVANDTWLRQLYTKNQTYTHANALLKTHVKSIANSSSIDTLEEEFNFLAKMNKGQLTASFTLNSHDAYAFRKLIDTYGEDGTIVISTCMFSMDNDTAILSFMCNQSTTANHPYVISFSDIIKAQ